MKANKSRSGRKQTATRIPANVDDGTRESRAARGDSTAASPSTSVGTGYASDYPPVPREFRPSEIVRWDEIKRIGSLIMALLTLLTLLGSAIWYVAKLDAKVDQLADDVRVMKVRAERSADEFARVVAKVDKVGEEISKQAHRIDSIERMGNKPPPK